MSTIGSDRFLALRESLGVSSWSVVRDIERENQVTGIRDSPLRDEQMDFEGMDAKHSGSARKLYSGVSRGIAFLRTRRGKCHNSTSRMKKDMFI